MKYLLPLLGVLFIGLKLTGSISWPWWIVLSPIWGSAVAGILIMLIAFVIIWKAESKNIRGYI